MTTEATPLETLNGTPIGERVRWLLGRVFGGPDSSFDAEAWAEAVSRDGEGLSNWLGTELAGHRVESARLVSETRAVVRVNCPNGRRYDLTCTVTDPPEVKIDNVRLDRVIPADMEMRDARPEDNDQILAVCRATPLVLSDGSEVTIDPGDDYFAYLRLMQRSDPLVVLHQGRVVAVHTGTLYPVRFQGRELRLGQILHSRVLPEYAGSGLWSVMNRAVIDRYAPPTAEGACAYYAVGNDSTRRLGGAQATWKCRPQRASLPCPLPGRPGTDIQGRRAGPEDVEQIVAVLNTCHEGEELYLPYSPESFGARVGRAPDVYGWDSVLIGEGAVLGVWHAGQRRAVTRSGETRVSVRSIVVDYGFVPGAEPEFERLLAAAADDAARLGATHLAVFTSEPSPTWPLLAGLADEIDPYEIATPYWQEPEDIAEHGLYVDPVYF